MTCARCSYCQGDHPEHLTPREIAVLEYMRDGKTNYEISRALGIGEKTVKGHAYVINQKLGTSSRTEAVVKALRQGLISLNPTTAP